VYLGQPSWNSEDRYSAQLAEVPHDRLSPLFQAVAEATEEAIYNSLLMATTARSRNAITGQEVVVERLPLAPLLRNRKLPCR
jgi:D-aminopeptidase